MNKNTGKNNVPLFSQILDYYSITDKWNLDTLVADFPNIYKLTGQDKVSKTYSFPKSYVSSASRERSAQSKGNGQGR